MIIQINLLICIVFFLAIIDLYYQTSTKLKWIKTKIIVFINHLMSNLNSRVLVQIISSWRINRMLKIREMM